ncbi:MAG: B12-binding domain-containing protein [Candidatus Kapabacteria bacterium]|nr:B12-binding domain-containing protein [Candidatus Kapabacteria bacterium]
MSLERRCTYDPLVELMAYYADAKTVAAVIDTENLSIEERLKQRIIGGDRLGIDRDLTTALQTYPALAIINDILLDGMKVVGELFGSGQMQLPFVLQSAETMKAAVAFLEPFMDKVEGAGAKGTMVLATVKGDVHDIGKNLVDIILSNNGYRVVNLGIKVPVETMLNAMEEHKANAIGMSGLLVKSTAIMKENLEYMQARGLDVPVVLGGAALNRRFVEKDLRAVYTGKLDYAQDAFDGLRFMQELTEGVQAAERESIEETKLGMEAKIQAAEDADLASVSVEVRAAQDVYAASSGGGTGAALDASLRLQADQENRADYAVNVRVHDDGSHQRVLELTSNVSRNEPVPVPPFYGSRIVENVLLDKVFEYINEIALIRGQWQFKRSKTTEVEYNRQMKEEAYPAFNELKLRSKREKLLEPKLVYGYFPCKADGNDLVIYKPLAEPDIHSTWTTVTPTSIQEKNVVEWMRYSFPRQKDGRHLCISDYFRPVSSSDFDVVAFHVVTAGQRATEYAHTLFESGNFKDYLFFHGLSVETAEALAEYWHKIVRAELGIGSKDADDVRRLFSQGYQGSRYSFGYPACPNLDDQVKLFELLRPERIGVTLTEEYQLVPEQSTSAIVCHHREARYFNIS